SVNDLIERGGADKIIFSGSRTGLEVDQIIISNLIDNNFLLAEQTVIGSGITFENIRNYLDLARNFIVGSSLKIDNKIQNHIDPNKVSNLVSCL
ncbi:MAG: BtpA/SgcQ family protein, partial [Candidatus Heimdallarchaeota archaeon]